MKVKKKSPPHRVSFIQVGLVLFFLVMFNFYSTAQSTTKTGNIRSCSVWGYPKQLGDATISSGNTITTGPTVTGSNSLSFSSSTSVLNFNAGESVTFGTPYPVECATLVDEFIQRDNTIVASWQPWDYYTLYTYTINGVYSPTTLNIEVKFVSRGGKFNIQCPDGTMMGIPDDYYNQLYVKLRVLKNGSPVWESGQTTTGGQTWNSTTTVSNGDVITFDYQVQAGLVGNCFPYPLGTTYFFFNKYNFKLTIPRDNF